jgi:hypothetical protein
MEIKFHSNENIDWHSIGIELELNWIESNSNWLN